MGWFESRRIVMEQTGNVWQSDRTFSELHKPNTRKAALTSFLISICISLYLYSISVFFTPCLCACFYAWFIFSFISPFCLLLFFLLSFLSVFFCFFFYLFFLSSYFSFFRHPDGTCEVLEVKCHTPFMENRPYKNYNNKGDSNSSSSSQGKGTYAVKEGLSISDRGPADSDRKSVV